MPRAQIDLFGSGPANPDGFRYGREVIDARAESALLERIRELPFRAFEFHGYTGRRRVVSYGWRYDFEAQHLHRVDDIPEFLLALREPAARFAGLDAAALTHVLVTEYAPGAAIGWHRDKGVFGEVVGVSLLSACTFRFRRTVPEGWERVSLELAPRSVYLLSGAARSEWEHSIPAVETTRYSVTFRTVRGE
jgi:alkylated DNA repair dioxygenase AlkB